MVVLALVYSGFMLAINPSRLADAKGAIPWIGIGIAVSEVLLAIGVIGMTSQVGRMAWRDRVRLRPIEWDAVGYRLRRNRPFWVFFWVSLVGGLGDAVVVVIAVLRYLPTQAWPVLLLPALDVWATLVIRKAIFNGVMGRRARPDGDLDLSTDAA